MVLPTRSNKSVSQSLAWTIIQMMKKLRRMLLKFKIKRISGQRLQRPRLIKLLLILLPVKMSVFKPYQIKRKVSLLRSVKQVSLRVMKLSWITSARL